MKAYTVNDIMSLRPCSTYSRDIVEMLWGAKTDAAAVLTARQIGDLAIPDKDRIWALVRLLCKREQRLFACDCADHALARVKSPDGRSSSAVAVARRFAEGQATAEELRYARYAAAATDATYAAIDAATDATYAAADAAFAAATDATYVATYATYATYATDATDATYAAERSWQIERLIAYHESEVPL